MHTVNCTTPQCACIVAQSGVFVLLLLQLNYKGWTMNTPDCALFSSLLTGAGPVLGQILDDVVPVLTQCLDPDGDPEMILQ